jgi:hypothetical protein
LASAATALAFAGTSLAGEITSSWSGNTGNWTDPTQWSTNPNYPNNGTPSGTTYDAVINAPGTGPYTVSLASNVTTDSVTLDSANATLSQTGGTLTTTSLNISAGTYVVNDSSLQINTLVNTGTIQVTNSGYVFLSSLPARWITPAARSRSTQAEPLLFSLRHARRVNSEIL